MEEAGDEGAPAAKRQTRVGEKLTELTILKVKGEGAMVG